MRLFASSCKRRRRSVYLGIVGAIASLSILGIFHLLSGRSESGPLEFSLGTRKSSAFQSKMGLAQCPPDHPLSVNGSDRWLARGFNFPNWDPDHKGLDPDDEMLSDLFYRGFTHVRLPINAENVMAPFSSPTQMAAYITALDQAVKRLTRLGFAISVDMHPSGGVFSDLNRTNPELSFEVLKSAWDVLVANSADWPLDTVYFELLNEPVNHEEWWQAAQTIVSHLNATAPGRKLIVGPGVWQRYEPLISSEPLKGENVIYAIHEYSPMVFTHQAMTWAEDSTLSLLANVPFPASIDHPAIQRQIADLEDSGNKDAANELRSAFQEPWNAERIAGIFRDTGKWAASHGVTVILNEYGVLNFAVKKVDRANWLRAVRKGAEDMCIGTTVWEYSDGFGIVDGETGQPFEYVMDALLK
nr:cellulase family glycosylhydrolase [uncultured Cohaesibacter sp.]